MIANIRHTSGLGNSAIYARFRDTNGYFWDFVALSWITPISADCKQFLTEVSDGDPATSLYVKTIALPTNPTTLGAIEVVLDSSGSVLGYEDVMSNIDSVLTAAHQAGSWSDTPPGVGAQAQVINVKVGANPVDGCEVWITTDVSGTNPIAGPSNTDASGNKTFYLDVGTYYAWCRKSGVNFTNPATVTVTAGGGTTNITGTAVSSSPTDNDWIIARDAIITAALRKIGGIDFGATASAAQITAGAEQLNALVKEWANDGIRLWNQEWKTEPLVATDADYPMAATVLSIDEAVVRDSSGYDFPVEIIPAERYFKILDKDYAGRPNKVCPKWTAANQLTLYCHPVPDTSYTLHYLATIRLKDFDATGDNPDLPVRWELALIFGLADLLAPEYGVPIPERERLTSKALYYKERAANGAQQPYKDEEVAPAYDG